MLVAMQMAWLAKAQWVSPPASLRMQPALPAQTAALWRHFPIGPDISLHPSQLQRLHKQGVNEKILRCQSSSLSPN